MNAGAAIIITGTIALFATDHPIAGTVGLVVIGYCVLLHYLDARRGRR